MTRTPPPRTQLTRRTLLGVAATAAVTGAVGAAPAVAAPRPRVGDLEVVSVRREHRLDRLWKAYGDRSGTLGWAGADGTYSTLLPDGRLVWLFNDTFLGPVGDGGAIRELGPVHNTFVTWRGRPLQTVLGAGSTEAAPLPTVGDPGGDTTWFWNGHGIVEDGLLRVVEFEQEASGDGHFGFAWIGTSIASFSLPDLQLVDVQPVASADDIQWGVQLVPHEGWTYVYGQRSHAFGKSAHLARAVEGDLLGDWQFWTGSGWSDDPTASVSVRDDVGSSYGVTLLDGTWVLSTSDSFLGPDLYLCAAGTPTGPFSDPVSVFTAPEGLPAADEEAEGDVYGPYNIAAHPELSRPGHLVLSYNVNSTVITDLWGDISYNRARFLEIGLART